MKPSKVAAVAAYTFIILAVVLQCVNCLYIFICVCVEVLKEERK